MISYNLTNFQKISESKVINLNDAVIDIINGLAKRVGAPTYKKTPVFRQNHRNYRNKPDKRINKQQNIITAADWEAIRNFKTTTLLKPEKGIDMEIDKIRGNLNKLTDKNYDEIYKDIAKILKNLVNLKTSEEELEKVGKSIFEIGSVNKFWSKLYAKLYKNLINEFPIMNQIYKKNFNSFMSVFENIRFIEKSGDYDLLCEVNKENEKRRGLSSFFVHLMNNNVIQVNEIILVINLMINKMKIEMCENKKKPIVDELGENLQVIILNGKKILSKDNEWDNIKKFISWISELNIKDFEGLSSKTVFKFMDLYDEL